MHHNLYKELLSPIYPPTVQCRRNATMTELRCSNVVHGLFVVADLQVVRNRVDLSLDETLWRARTDNLRQVYHPAASGADHIDVCWYVSEVKRRQRLWWMRLWPTYKAVNMVRSGHSPLNRFRRLRIQFKQQLNLFCDNVGDSVCSHHHSAEHQFYDNVLLVWQTYWARTTDDTYQRSNAQAWVCMSSSSSSIRPSGRNSDSMIGVWHSILCPPTRAIGTASSAGI